MPSKADHYRAKAAECQLRATEAQDFDVKQQFRELGRQWLTLAEQTERISR